MVGRRKGLVLLIYCAATLVLCRASGLCDPDPCQNDGACVATSLSEYTCQCAYGYAGQVCEIDIDFCSSGPCLNSGNCTDGVFTFSCECPAGFSGRQCERDIDECQGDPCGEFGSCVDGAGQYSCVCDRGYTGINCETNIDDCSQDPCVNGDCIDQVGGFVCECAPSFAGANCSIMTECSSDEDTCQNNGVCNVTMEGGERETYCVCLAGYTGPNCETDIDECSGSPCSNGGTCLDLIGRYSCICPVDFTDDTCSTQIDPCDPELVPCENDAICVNGDCFCRNGFTGILCEVNIDDCSSAPCYNGGACIDGVAGFTCECMEGFTGDLCNISSSDACSSLPCLNGGTCSTIGIMEYMCVCPMAFTGANCSEMVDFCLSDPCLVNTTAACINTPGGFECMCVPGYEGDVCESDIDVCELLDPCVNGGSCMDMDGLQYTCVCLDGYQGLNCSEEIDECLSDPCQNGGTCQDQVAGYICQCQLGFTGSECQENIDDCLPTSCQNGATCLDMVDGYTCVCPVGFTGEDCSTVVVGCTQEPCGNGGTCLEDGEGYLCECAPGFTGDNCLVDIDDCEPNPCQEGGSCVDGIDSFSCVCPVGFTSTLCDNQIDRCSPNPCLNGGTCTSQSNGSSCICPEEHTGSRCEIEICTLDCQNDGECINNDRGNPTCNCGPGFTGPLCETQFHACNATPCAGNSTCLPLVNQTYLCLCGAGYTGELCDEEIDECDGEPCGENGVCRDIVGGFECMCRNGFTGEQCQTNIDDCSPNPCRYNSTCIDLVANYSCECAPGFEGHNCTIDIDLCDPLPCMNGGSCSQNLTEGSVNCSCAAGYQGTFCQFDINECRSETPPCLNGGECVNTHGSFNCVCLSGFSGVVCEDNFHDDCNGIDVCMNNATCEDIGSDFVCICPPGYTGVICDIETDDCESDPCQNGGICRDEFLDFSCVCTEDFTGRVCDINLNPCSSNPCLNDGVCLNLQPEVFSCECAPGFTGPLCEVDIDDCESNPCLMGSSCSDDINNFTCVCAPGFSGRLCDHNFIDNCAFPFCLNGGTCVDVGADYVCLCDAGFTGPNCEYGTNECQDNPCLNGGTCRDLFGSFECRCPLGYTGQVCEFNINDCFEVNCHNGFCVDMANDFTCVCDPGYTGVQCDEDIDECETVECLFGGTCHDGINNYTCECAIGFEGRHCEQNIDDCLETDCGNGTCRDLVNDYYCECVMGYTGSACETMIDECEQQPCMNGAMCLDRLNNFTCVCVEGFEGRFCEFDIDDCADNPCLNGGSCRDGMNNFTCDCVFGYGGEDCGTILDLCSPDTCLNGGTCNTTAPGITECYCTPQYTGPACATYINLCLEPDRCANGGVCVPTELDGAPAFTCNCSDFYRGTTCEIFDPCYTQPCHNNASCVVDNSTELEYRCDCISPFIGYTCFYQDLCFLDQPCYNGATCMNHIPALDNTTGVGTFSCECAPCFTGSSCELAACYYEPCSNGGTCVMDTSSDLGYFCQCPLYWHGTNCTQEINVVTPSFSGSSYLSHLLPNSSDSEFNYSLVILTSQPSGLVLYLTHSDPQTHIALGLEGGQLVLYVGSEPGSVELRSQVVVNDSEWHAVEVQVDTQQASLLVDNEIERVSISRESPLIEADAVVYVGGSPDLSLLGSDVGQIMGLVGCVHDRAANGDSVELTVVPHEGRDITQCSQPVCPYIQCQNGAQCSDTAEPPGYTCHCLPFFSGQFCETALPVCDPNPCLFGGLCRDEHPTFGCQCPLGRAGRTCGEELSITVPSFSGDSYIAYPSGVFFPTGAQYLTVSLTFTPATSNGLLFFVSTSETDFIDHFSVALIDGHIELRINLGSGQSFIVSETMLDLNSWHTVTATLSSATSELTVDDEPLIRGSTQSIFIVLNTHSLVWLGGYASFIDPSSATGTEEGFTGCISSLTINDQSVDLIPDADHGYGVSQCNTSSCEARPCMNGGSCVEEGPSFVCVCPPGLSGPLCSRDSDRCSSEPGLCADGATCVRSEDGTTYSCICPIGRDGERCDEEIDIQTPEFNTTSYLQYNPHLFDPPLATVALRFNPSSPNGLLFYYGDHRQNPDFFSVGLIQQRVEYRFDLGSGANVLIGDRVDLNSWHYVVVTLNGRRGTLMVDNETVVHSQLGGALIVLNAAGDIFVGGVSDYDTVSPHAGTEVGFTGCISDIEINGVTVDLLGAAIGGQGISECVADLCSDLMCSNGGSCQVVEHSQPVCLCPLGFAGPTCNSIVDVEVPYFTGESYLVHDSLTGVFATTSLTLEVRPSSLNGLLLFNKQAMNGVDYIAVLIREGVVEFWYDLGSGPATIRSTESLEVNVWHTIEVYRSGASGQLIVDDMIPVSGISPGSLTALQLGGPLFVGGVIDSSSGDLPSMIRGVGGYNGCIRSLVSNSDTISLVSAANYGAGIEECPQLPCTTNPCLNNGVCYVKSGDGFQCQCSLPFTGAICSLRVDNFSEAKFSGQSYLQFSADAVNIDQQLISNAIEISLTLTDLSGLLFYLGPAEPTPGQDYLYIALSEGLVELRYELGAGEAVALTSQTLSVGESYTISVNRNGRNSVLSVSNGDSVSIESSPFATLLNTVETGFAAYLGGSPSVTSLTGGLYTTGISACVTGASIGRAGDIQNLPLSSSTAGHAVDTCT